MLHPWQAGTLGESEPITKGAYCASLPSSTSVSDMLDGKFDGFVGSIVSTAVRGGLIAGGLYIAGDRKHLWRDALAGALAIETFVILYTLARKAALEKKVQNARPLP